MLLWHCRRLVVVDGGHDDVAGAEEGERGLWWLVAAVVAAVDCGLQIAEGDKRELLREKEERERNGCCVAAVACW